MRELIYFQYNNIVHKTLSTFTVYCKSTITYLLSLYRTVFQPPPPPPTSRLIPSFMAQLAVV